MKHLDPPGGVEFDHSLEGQEGATIDIIYTTTISGPWQMCADDNGQPDCTTPVVPPIDLPDDLDGYVTSESFYFWLVNDDVPAAIETGAHNLVITASLANTPTVTSWAVDTLWAGDWLAPANGGGEPTEFTYLPLILKND